MDTHTHARARTHTHTHRCGTHTHYSPCCNILKYEAGTLKSYFFASLRHNALHGFYLNGAFPLSAFPTFLPVAQEFKLRLVNDTDPNLNLSIGRLEIQHDNTWGTICDDFFDINAASVACRMLGFGGALAVYPRAQLGQGSADQPIWLDDISCRYGNETTFAECGHSEFRVENCYHGEDVGIACYSECVQNA